MSVFAIAVRNQRRRALNAAAEAATGRRRLLLGDGKSVPASREAVEEIIDAEFWPSGGALKEGVVRGLMKEPIIAPKVMGKTVAKGKWFSLLRKHKAIVAATAGGAGFAAMTDEAIESLTDDGGFSDVGEILFMHCMLHRAAEATTDGAKLDELATAMNELVELEQSVGVPFDPAVCTAGGYAGRYNIEMEEGAQPPQPGAPGIGGTPTGSESDLLDLLAGGDSGGMFAPGQGNGDTVYYEYNMDASLTTRESEMLRRLYATLGMGEERGRAHLAELFTALRMSKLFKQRNI